MDDEMIQDIKFVNRKKIKNGGAGPDIEVIKDFFEPDLYHCIISSWRRAGRNATYKDQRVITVRAEGLKQARQKVKKQLKG